MNGISYRDGRNPAPLRLEAQDQGLVFEYGHGPGKCDVLGAREAWVFEYEDLYYMTYDGAGPGSHPDVSVSDAEGGGGFAARTMAQALRHHPMETDAPGGDSVSHMRRSIGLAWLDLPLMPPLPTVET